MTTVKTKRGVSELCAGAPLPGRARGGAQRSRRALCGRHHAGHGRSDRSGRSGTIRSRGNSCQTRANRIDGRRSAAIRSATTPSARSTGIVHRYPDRVLLKLVNACAVYCRFCFRREMIGPGRGGLSPAALDGGARIYRRQSAHLGSDPNRRRSAHRVGAPPQGFIRAAWRHRPCEGDPRAYPGADCGAGADFSRDGPRAAHCKTRRPSWCSRQSPARTDCEGARRVRALDRRRHPDALAIGAAARRQRRCRDAWRSDARAGRVPDQAVLPAPRRPCARHRALSHHHR